MEAIINKRCCVQCDNGGAGSLEDPPIVPWWMQMVEERTDEERELTES